MRDAEESRPHFTVLLAIVALPAAEAQAATYTTGYSLVGQDVVQQRCFYATASGIKPAANGMDVDFKAFIYKKVRSSSLGCSTSNSAASFYSTESSIRAVLYRTSDMTICSATSFGDTPSGYTSFGIGKTWNKSGTCGTTTWFLVGGDGYWNNAYSNSFDGPFTSSFSL